MQTQPSGNKSPDIHKIQQTPPSSAGPTVTSASGHTKHSSEDSSTRSSTSSWLVYRKTKHNFNISLFSGVKNLLLQLIWTS